MFNVTLIKEELFGLVGFRQPANPKYQIVDSDNEGSQSGLFVTDNPYAKIEYLKDNQDYAAISDADFNKFLKQLMQTSITNICTQVFSEREDFIDRGLIYSNPYNKAELLDIPVGFVGYEVEQCDAKSVAFVINRLITEFESEAKIDLIVFNSNLKQPILTQNVTASPFYHQETVDLICNNLGYYKGKFYIGFISNGTLKTWKRNYENSNTKDDISSLGIRSIVVEGHTSNELFDLNTVKYTEDYCGLNFDITTVDDYTDIILNNKKLFARAIYLDCIIACLNVYCATLRKNSNERKSNELYGLVMLEIEGTRPDDNVVHVRGLRPQMLFEISQIREQLLTLTSGFFGKGYWVDTQD